MELTEPDESGRCKVREVPQSEFLLDVDTLIMAIGQKVESNILPETINSTSWGTVITDEFGQTSEPGILPLAIVLAEQNSSRSSWQSPEVAKILTVIYVADYRKSTHSK